MRHALLLGVATSVPMSVMGGKPASTTTSDCSFDESSTIFWMRRNAVLRGGGVMIPTPAEENRDEKTSHDVTVEEKGPSFDAALVEHREALPSSMEGSLNNQAPYNIGIGSTPANEQPSLRLRPRVVCLNIMVAGLSGLGKTTACASLLESWQGSSAPLKRRSSSMPGGLTKHVDPSRLFERYDSQENTLLRVRIIDTPGFGNRIRYADAVRPIARYIAQCRKRQYREETSPRFLSDDNSEEDHLVHLCLYFLSPGRILEMDLHFLKHVQKQVVIVPIIAKADTLTDEEVAAYRATVVHIFQHNGIVPYNFDEPLSQLEKTNHVVTSRQKLYSRGRRAGEPLAIVSRDGFYPWGKVRALDSNHSDLGLVRDLLLSGHTENFVELSREKYDVFRAQTIRRRNVGDGIKHVALGLLAVRAFGVRLLRWDSGSAPRATAGAAIETVQGMGKRLKNLVGLVLAGPSDAIDGDNTTARQTVEKGSANNDQEPRIEQEVASSGVEHRDKRDGRRRANPLLGVFGLVNDRECRTSEKPANPLLGIYGVLDG